MNNNLTFLFLLFFLYGLDSHAQNCPAAVAGQLANTNSPIFVGDTTPAPTYTVVPTGLPNTEFLVVRQDTLAADGFGPPILISSLDGRVVPNDLGLMTCQELCLVPFSYNLSQIQLVVDSLLNGQYLAGASCCTAAGNFFPGLCDSLNAQGIFSGADVQNLNDVIAFTGAVAGTNSSETSIPNLVSTISQLNAFIGLFGNCAANVPEICYQVNTSDTAHSCYYVVLPNAATIVLASPDTINAMTNSTYQCMATYLPNSSTENIIWQVGMPDLGCSIDNMGMLTTDTTAGRVWVYAQGTRGCQVDSILVEIGGAINVALLPSNNLSLQATPMPFDHNLVVEMDVLAGVYQLELLDVMGKVVYQEVQEWAEGSQQWRLSTVDLPAGMYVLQVAGAQVRGSVLVIKQ